MCDGNIKACARNRHCIGLSTNWNSGAHAEGDALIDEILSLGFDRVECGYGLMHGHVDGIRRRVADGSVIVTSIHAYAPTPPGDVCGGPEAVTLAELSDWRRLEAISGLRRSLVLAESLQSQAVIAHAGRVAMRPISPVLMKLARRNRQASRRYQWHSARLMRHRETLAPKHLSQLYRSLDQILPAFEQSGISLCLEILPEGETLPTESEWIELQRRYPTSALRYWHDTGHAHIRERLGFGYQRPWLERIMPQCAGVHLHSNDGTRDLHCLPPEGTIRFSDFSFLAESDMITVLEPDPCTPAFSVRQSADYLARVWRNRKPSPAQIGFR